MKFTGILRKIEVGQFYANDYVEDGIKGTNIILILTQKENAPQFQTRTETMWLRNNEVPTISQLICDIN